MANNPLYAHLATRALISVAGPDWRGFLQGLLTQDVETLAPGELRYGALLTPQGRLLYDLFIAGADGGCRLEVEASQREAIAQRLTMYRLRAKVEIAIEETPVLALFGGETDPGPGWMSDPRLPGLGWRSYGALPPEGAAEAPQAAYEAHRLALGVPGPADLGSDKRYPIEADLDLLGGVDFHKGCFVGQETTSRMKRRGQVKSRMLPIAFEGVPPAPGAEVLAGGTLRAGEVLSGQDGRAMALLRLDRIQDAELTVDGRPVRVETPDWMAQALGE